MKRNSLPNLCRSSKFPPVYSLFSGSVLGLLAVVTVATTGCDDTKHQPPPPPPPIISSHPRSTSSAQVTIEEHEETEVEDAGAEDAPTRVGIPADSTGRLLLDDGGPRKPMPRPIDLVANEPLPADQIDAQELSGVTLTASWQWLKVPDPANAPEVASSEIAKLKRKSKSIWTVELAEIGRMRITFSSPTFTLNQHVQLRARTSVYGHLLLWPDSVAYRSLPVGSLRPLLDERRPDVTPVVTGRVRPKVAHGSKFGFPTSTAVVTTPWGSLKLEQMRSQNVGAGGRLLCRTLVELVGAKPSSPVCKLQNMPVRAKYQWKRGGGTEFVVDTFVIRTDFPPSTFLTPPKRASFRPEGLPPSGSGIFLTRDQLTKLRTRPTKNDPSRNDPEAIGAPGEGIVLHNFTNSMKFFLLDGIPIAWVRPHERKYIIGPRDGSYVTQWRSFLGWDIHKPKMLRVPARVTIGEPPDAGAPKPVGSSSAP